MFSARASCLLYCVILVVLSVCLFIKENNVECSTPSISVVERLSKAIKSVKQLKSNVSVRNAAANAIVPPPQLPSSFKALFKESIGSVSGVQYYDLVNSRMRIDISLDGNVYSSVALYNERRELRDEMPNFLIPPTAKYVGNQEINGKNCEHWKSVTPQSIVDYWVYSNIVEEKEIYYPAKIWIRVKATNPLDYQIEFDNVEIGPIDDSIFSIWKNAGCQAPAEPTIFTVQGYIRDAVSGQVVAGLSVNAIFGSERRIVKSDQFGVYTIEKVPAHSLLTLEMGMSESYFEFSKNVSEITGNINLGNEADIFLCPYSNNPDSLKFILSWGSAPLDLDAHLVMPHGCETQYNNKMCNVSDGFATLDQDTVDGFGPETIDIIPNYNVPGVYSYYVYNHGSNAIPFSDDAVVKIYNLFGLAKQINIPKGKYSNSDRYWNVFDLVVTKSTKIEFKSINTVSKKRS